MISSARGANARPASVTVLFVTQSEAADAKQNKKSQGKPEIWKIKEGVLSTVIKVWNVNDNLIALL